MKHPDHPQRKFNAFSLYHQIAFLEVCWQLEATNRAVQSDVDRQARSDLQSQTSLILDETRRGQRQQAVWVPFVWLFL